MGRRRRGGGWGGGGEGGGGGGGGGGVGFGVESGLMILLLPDFALRRSSVDPDFAEERAAALGAGLGVALYSHEGVVAGDLERALRACPRVEGKDELAVLRGW